MPRIAKKSAAKPAKSAAKKAKPAAPAKKKTAARKPAAARKLPLAAKPVAAPTRAASATASRVMNRARGGTPEVVAVLVTNEAIAVEAYYIAERRRRLGLPGDSQADWLEAERNLRG